MLDVRYVAGLFDGDGYVRINRWEKPESTHIRYNIHAGINMTHRPIIEDLHRQFAGNLHKTRRPSIKPTHRTLYSWTVTSAAAAAFLRLIRPHCIVKADEIDIALKLQDSIDEWNHRLGWHYGVHPRRPEIRAYRERLFAEIAELKRVRFDPT